MTWAAITFSIITCAAMLVCVLFFPTIKLGRVKISSYWVATLIGAAVVVLAGGADVGAIGRALVADSAINPLKILALFISMTVLSIYLDELGFFRYLASVTLRRARTGQMRLFLSLYLIVSVLTVFTSNDIIVLSFTPFICYFARSAKIDPTPYLAAEFVAANTWSMALVIGNPTNIYLAAANGIDFVTYLKFSILPTFAAGATALVMLLLLFGRRLRAPISGEPEEARVTDRPMLAVGIAHLAVCTIMLAVGPYIGAEMWLVSVLAAVSLAAITLIVSAVRRNRPTALIKSIKRAPFQLVPFVLSMFVIILVLTQRGVTGQIGKLLGSGGAAVWKYGFASFLSANLINNIPMSVLFSSIIGSACPGNILAVMAAVIGSNLGAFLTPVGALAGIMWSSILGTNGIKFGYLDFLKMGIVVAVPAMCAALGALELAGLAFL